MQAQLSAPLVSSAVDEAGCTISIKRTGPKASGAPTECVQPQTSSYATGQADRQQTGSPLAFSRSARGTAAGDDP
jgi:hypothetical protein